MMSKPGIIFLNRRPYFNSLYTINKDDLAEYKLSDINLDTLQYALQIRLFNVLQSIQFQDGYNKPDCLYLKNDKAQLVYFNQKAKTIDANGMREFMCQLYICLIELENRGLHLRGISLSSIWFIENIPIINMQDIDFSLPIGKDSTNSRVAEHMETIKKQILNIQLPNFMTYEQLQYNYEEYLKINYNPQQPLKPPFFSYIRFLMQFDKPVQLSVQQANSCVCKIENNNLIKTFVNKHRRKIDQFYKDPDHIVFKTTKLEDDENMQYTLINIERELQFLEKLNESDQFVELYFYMRFQNQTYFFLRSYPFDLHNYAVKFSSQKEEWIKFVYMFAKQFAESLCSLHELNIIHRDLKPQNIFLRDLTFPLNQIVLADFDRSKIFKGITQVHQITNYNHGLTIAYDPPELNYNEQTSKSDIWQYGLILLQIANFGKYHGFQNGLSFIERDIYEKKFGQEQIFQLLKDNYLIDFINVIAACLQYEPNKRPTAQDLWRDVGRIFRARYITFKQIQ